jgi:hypothetical protein
MKRGSNGKYEIAAVGGESARTFVPNPLPPEPPLVLQGPIQLLLDAIPRTQYLFSSFSRVMLSWVYAGFTYRMFAFRKCPVVPGHGL